MQKKLLVATGLLIWLWCLSGAELSLYADCQSYLTKTGVISAARMGYSAAVVGDVNDDQIDDFVIGAPGVFRQATMSYGGWADSSGHVYLYSGATGNLIRSHVDTRGYYNTRNAELGYSVAVAGDVDNDGVPDYIVGSPTYYNNGYYLGRFQIFSGSTGNTIASVAGAGNYRFGHSVAGLGDINGDSRSEVIVGAPQYGSTGRVYVYGYVSGTFGLIGTLDGPTGTAWFGFSVSAVDVNNDGTKDILVSTKTAAAPKVYIYNGSSRAVIDSIGGFAGGTELRVCGLGDVNDDNYSDFVVGCYNPGALYNHEAKLYSGQNRSLLHTYTSGVSGFGMSVSTAGDFDDDNIPDVLIGQGSGSAYVYSCSASKSYGLLRTVSGSGDFGTTVAGPEGTDNDGYGLLIAGAPNSNTATIFSCGFPEVDFSGSPRVGIPPVTVTFSGVAITPDPITAWSWSFGDGGSSSVQNPSHQYTNTGAYTVTLIATGFNGADTVSKSDYVSFKSEYACGDVDGNDAIDIGDYVYLIAFIFQGGPAPIGSGDVNCDASVDIGDAVYIGQYIFNGGPAPCAGC